jgi:hypothetical protein
MLLAPLQITPDADTPIADGAIAPVRRPATGDDVWPV